MHSTTPKVLHTFAGRTILGHALTAALAVEPEHLVVVVRHERDMVAKAVLELAPHAIIADQDEIPGTGRAVQCGLETLDKVIGETQGTILVTSGDVPLLEDSTLSALVEENEKEGAAVTLLTTEVANPFGYGRIIRVAKQVAAIVEESDATYPQKQIKEINAGIYAFDATFLRQTLPTLGQSNEQGEVYLTDTIAAARKQGRKVASFFLSDTAQAEGCNDRWQMATLHAELNKRICKKWMLRGTTIVDPFSTWIDVHVELGQDTHIEPGVRLQGHTKIGEGCYIGPGCSLHDAIVEDGAILESQVHATTTTITKGAHIAPFTLVNQEHFDEAIAATARIAAQGTTHSTIQEEKA